MRLLPNSASSKWADVTELVQCQDLDVMDMDGSLATERFLESMEKMKEKDAKSGMAIRWMLAVNREGTGLEIQLQALPCAAAAIQAHPLLREDNVAVMVVSRHPVTAEFFDGKSAAGPVPILFSTKPEAAAEAFKASPEMAHHMIQLLASKLLMVEELDREGAEAYVLSPREGRASRPFQRLYSKPAEASKKSKKSAGAGTFTGTIPKKPRTETGKEGSSSRSSSKSREQGTPSKSPPSSKKTGGEQGRRDQPSEAGRPTEQSSEPGGHNSNTGIVYCN